MFLATAHLPRSHRPRRSHPAPRKDSAPRLCALFSACRGLSAKESPCSARCTHRTPSRDNCTADSSRQSVHRKAESRGAGTHPASQMLFRRSSGRPPAAPPAASPSPGSGHKSRRCASLDTSNPTEIRGPPAALPLSAKFPAKFPWLFVLPRSSSPTLLGGAFSKSHRSIALRSTAMSACLYGIGVIPLRFGLQPMSLGVTLRAEKNDVRLLLLAPLASRSIWSELLSFRSISNCSWPLAHPRVKRSPERKGILKCPY